MTKKDPFKVNVHVQEVIWGIFNTMLLSSFEGAANVENVMVGQLKTLRYLN